MGISGQPHRLSLPNGRGSVSHFRRASIKEVVIIDPPTSHKQAPHFLNVLRVLDIPEALGLLAPRVKLTLIYAKDKAFDRTCRDLPHRGSGEEVCAEVRLCGASLPISFAAVTVGNSNYLDGRFQFTVDHQIREAAKLLTTGGVHVD